jgi:uncharacterized protein YdhG (YjbR/CyaY superfamily)
MLRELRKTIRDAAPGAVETISYEIPTYKLKGYLVHFGLFKDHIGFFPTSSGRRNFKKELSKYKGGPGTVQFSLDEKVPYALVRRIVKFRVRENLEREASTVKKKRSRT